MLILYGNDSGKDMLKKVGYKFKNESLLKSKILSIESRLDIINKKYLSFDSENKSRKYDFYDELAKVENQLGRSIDIETITVKRWNHIVKNINVNGSRDNRQRDTR